MADSMIGMMVYVCYRDAGVIHNVTMHNYALLCVTMCYAGVMANLCGFLNSFPGHLTT